MADIDEGIPLKNVINIVESIQKEFLLSDVYILRTTNGWNLFSLDKIPLKMVWIINNCFKEFCKDYNRISFYIRKFYVLRMGSDKSIEAIINAPREPLFVLSNAHRIFFTNVLPDFETRYELFQFDEYERFVITKFKSNKHGWRLE